MLERSWQAYKDRGVTLVGVNIQDKDEAGAEVRRAVRPHLPERARPRRARVSVDYGVYGVPETFFIDRAGRIRVKHVGAVTDAVLKRPRRSPARRAGVTRSAPRRALLARWPC